jgi:hypothetical protein
MSRLATITMFVLAAASHVAAQTSPVQPTYNLANLRTYVLSPEGMSWQTARTYSRTLGGHLVAINDPGEQAFIQSRFRSPTTPALWIGLSDEVTEGVFTWDGGEPVTFTNFCLGEPGLSGDVEDYVEIVPVLGGCWNDDSSPNPGSFEPTQAIIELPHGDRVNFDLPFPPGQACVCPFPTPLGAATHPEGISWNGVGGTGRPPIVTTLPLEGMPVSGSQYLRVPGAGILAVPFGGPFARPAPAHINEVRIAVPLGTRGVSFAWDFITKQTMSTGANDGVDISVVDAAGTLIANFVYEDTSALPSSLANGTYCSESGGTLVLPAGPQIASAALPPLPYPAYLSIACWNGGTDLFSSIVHVDAVHFWGAGQFRLDITAPFGPGSIRLQNVGGGPGNTYWTAVTLGQGSFPFGWLFGLDIAGGELISQVGSGTPFSGTLNGGGVSTFTLPAGVPSGLQVYAVSVQFENAGLAGYQLAASPLEHFVTQ